MRNILTASLLAASFLVAGNAAFAATEKVVDLASTQVADSTQICEAPSVGPTGGGWASLSDRCPSGHGGHGGLGGGWTCIDVNGSGGHCLGGFGGMWGTAFWSPNEVNLISNDCVDLFTKADPTQITEATVSLSVTVKV